MSVCWCGWVWVWVCVGGRGGRERSPRSGRGSQRAGRVAPDSRRQRCGGPAASKALPAPLLRTQSPPAPPPPTVALIPWR